VDVLAAVGPEARYLALAAKTSPHPPSKTVWFTDADEATEWLRDNLHPHDRLLIKGSRGMRMERIVAGLGEKG
ncbi:MAG: hypothetical protein V1742_02310, partial [Pseudomonadota bacterium]